MYKNTSNFVPFQHDGAEVKNNLINFARTQKSAEAQGALASALIYSNLVDYLAKHLYENLNKMMTIYLFRQFGGVVFIDNSSKKFNLPLGTLKKELLMIIQVVILTVT